MKNESVSVLTRTISLKFIGDFPLKRRIVWLEQSSALVKTIRVRYAWQTSVISNNEPAAKIVRSVSRLGTQFPAEL